jgi:transposase
VWPRIKRRAAKFKAHIVFIDETGYLMSPNVRETWALVGVGAELDCSTRHHRKVSCIGALSISPSRRVDLNLRFHVTRSIRQEQVLEFLSQLRRQLRGRIIVIWDNLQAHRSRLVKQWVRRHRSVQLEFLPGYAPELNPIEGVWGYSKNNPLANFCPMDVNELHRKVHRETGKLTRRPDLLESFVRMTPLKIRIQKRSY